MEPLLEVKNLSTHFHVGRSVQKAVDGVSFHVNEGETVGIVGESGCGKSVTSLSIMRLIAPPGEITGGEIVFQGTDVRQQSEGAMRMLRGNRISMIFQEPMTSLNPVFTIGNQMSESIRLHLGLGKKDAWQRSIELLQAVGMSGPERIVHEYPHRLSGGMRQRVMIATAMACNPALLIADEPTTALDVTIQAQILDLMRKLTVDSNTAIMLITHDLGVVAEMCQRVVVMYAGRVVEETDVEQLFENPQHPYTIGLLESIPKLDVERTRLSSIPGNVPSPRRMPTGCKFAPRCAHATQLCHEQEPELLSVGDNHLSRCWLHQEPHEGGVGYATTTAGS